MRLSITYGSASITYFMKQLLLLLPIVVLFACGPNKDDEKFLRDFYQLPNEAVQAIEWTYTTKHANGSTLPDSLTSANREFKFENNRLVKIIAFDSLFRVRSNTDIVYSGDSLLITEHQRDADFVIDIAKRERDVVFTKTDQKSHTLIETVTMTYDSTMSRVARKVFINGGGTTIKEEIYTYEKPSELRIQERTLAGSTMEKVTSLDKRNTWDQMLVIKGGAPIRLITRTTYYRDIDIVTMEYKK
jgi:hypothetical protein